MQIHTTCRNTKLTPTMRRFLEERLARLERFTFVREAHVVLETSKYRQLAEILLKTRTRELVCRKESHEMDTAIEVAVSHLERQLKKMKEKRSTRILHDGTRPNGDEALGAVRSAARVALRGAPAVAAPAKGKAKTAAARRTAALAEDEDANSPRVVPAKPHAKPLSVEEAVLALGGGQADFLAFVNADTEELNVVYRRKDGDLGWIERGGRRRPRG